MDDSTKQTLGYTEAGVGIALAGRALYRRLTCYDFRGRTVLITGSSRGLGLVLARQLAARGARIVLSACDLGELERAATDLLAHGAEVLSIPCDVTHPDPVKSMIEQIDRQWGSIDVVINNAGTIQTGPLETMTLEDYDEAMKTHFYGALYVTDSVLPQMRRRGEGRIVNIASIGGRISVPHMVPYSASKFALVGYSLGLRSELAQEGIAVTTICPGLMRTGSPRNAYFKGQHRAEYAWFKISDSLPVASMSVERAASKIINACRYGDAYLVLGVPVQLAEKLYSLSPGLAADALGLVNRMLPGAGGIGQRRLPGRESESSWSESVLTRLTQRAAARNNEI